VSIFFRKRSEMSLLPSTCKLLPLLPFVVGTIASRVSSFPHCLLSSFGTDGLGHRVEADLSCIAVAHELGVEYVIQPLTKLEHLSPRDYHDDWFRFLRSLANPRNATHLPVDHFASKLRSIFSYYSSFRHVNAPMTVRLREPLPWIGNCRKHGWLDAFPAARSSICRPPNYTVWSNDNCFDRFWCTTVRTGHWTAVLPRIQHAYLAAPTRPPTRFHLDEINVVMHIRTGDARARALPFLYFRRVHDALLQRHQHHQHAHSAAPPQTLRFIIHTDSFGLEAGVIAAEGVEVYHEGDVEIQVVFEQMIRSDVLVMSRSSFSNAAALIGNMTALWPQCENERTPLPQWHLVPCTGLLNLSSLAWPPPRGPIQRLGDSSLKILTHRRRRRPSSGD